MIVVSVPADPGDQLESGWFEPRRRERDRPQEPGHALGQT